MMIYNEDEITENMTEIYEDWMLILDTQILEWARAKGQTRLHVCSGRKLSVGKTGQNGNLWSSSLPVLSRVT